MTQEQSTLPHVPSAPYLPDAPDAIFPGGTSDAEACVPSVGARLLSLFLRPTSPSPALGVVVAATLIVVETIVVYLLKQVAPMERLGAVFLLGVLVVSTVWRLTLAVATSIASAITFDVVRNWPAGDAVPTAVENVVGQASFLVVALLANALAGLARARADEADQRRREADLAAELARLMLRASNLDSALDKAAHLLAQVLELPFAELHREVVSSDERRTAIVLRDGAVVLGTLVVPSDVPTRTLQRLRDRVAPPLEALLRAACDRENITNALEVSVEDLERSFQRSSGLAEQQAALRRIATLVAHGVTPSEVFSAVVEEVARCLGVCGAVLIRFPPGGDAVLIAVHGDPGSNTMSVGERVSLDDGNVTPTLLKTRSGGPRPDSRDDPVDDDAIGIRGLGPPPRVEAPIIVDGRVWGAVIANASRPDLLPADAEGRIRDFADLVATSIANAATREELTASRKRIVAAADNARRRLERDLHDGAQQRLESLKLDVRLAESLAPPELNDLRRQLSQIVAGLAGVSEDLHEFSRGIHPAVLASGLAPALWTLARRSAVPVTLDVDVDTRLAESVEVAAYYIVAEALTNIAKHARASEVHACVHVEEPNLSLSIRDDGIGGANPCKGSGLIGLIDRVEALGGQMEIMSSARDGTSLHVTIPLTNEEPAGGRAELDVPCRALIALVPGDPPQRTGPAITEEQPRHHAPKF